MSEQLDYQLEAWLALAYKGSDIDSFDNPRPVEHFFTFKNKNDAEAEVAELRSLNFEADVTKRVLFRTRVYASHDSTCATKPSPGFSPPWSVSLTSTQVSTTVLVASSGP